MLLGEQGAAMMVDGHLDAPLVHHLSQIAVAAAGLAGPAHAQQEDLDRKRRGSNRHNWTAPQTAAFS